MRFPGTGRAAYALAWKGGLVGGLLASASSLGASQEPLPPEAVGLPPAADVTVDFSRDIRPILENACLRCHGPDRPKSGFRLDNREDALKEANYDKPIVPGESARSALIWYVAHQIEEWEMPPVGKGEPLTDEQVSLLRAWIDQGVPWEEEAPPPARTLEGTPLAGWFLVDGDEARFREHHWVHEGWQAGLEAFRFREHLDRDTELVTTGRALREDYAVTLELRRREVGFVRGGFEQYRRYYDDRGGFFEPFAVPQFELGNDLALDLGRAFLEGGLVRPGLPEVVVGYEYRFRDGDKSTLQWLPSTQSGVRNIRPNRKQVDEQVHLARARLRHTVGGVELEDEFRFEIYDLQTHRAGAKPWPANTDGTTLFIEEATDYHRLANTLTAERQVREWLLLSGGYLYTDLDGEASFRQQTFDAAGQPASGLFWSGDEITLEHRSHTVNANAQLGPWGGWVFYAGLQPEWSRQSGFGQVRLDEGLPPLPGGGVAPAVIEADLDRFLVEEQAGFRMSSIPATVLFGEGRWRQESLSQFEESLGSTSGTNPDFVRDTEASNLLQDYKGGLHVSPWQRLSWSAHYRKRLRKNDYDHERDFHAAGNAYSAFITGQETDTDEVETKLTLRPARWIKTTVSFRLEATDYANRTDPVVPFSPGGWLGEAGEYEARVYGLGLVLTPIRKLYLSVTLTYADTRTRAFDNGAAAIVPFDGDVYSVLSSGSYAWNDTTDLTFSHHFSRGDYAQDNAADGLPVGLRYDQHSLRAGLERRFTDHLSSRLQYGFFLYDEPSSEGRNDYTAHGVFGSLQVRFP